jgi:hypothetical protein
MVNSLRCHVARCSRSWKDVQDRGKWGVWPEIDRKADRVTWVFVPKERYSPRVISLRCAQSRRSTHSREAMSYANRLKHLVVPCMTFDNTSSTAQDNERRCARREIYQ